MRELKDTTKLNLITTIFILIVISNTYLYRLPWNCEVPVGYFGEMVFHIVTAQLYLFCNGVILLEFVAICLHHQAFYKMYSHSLDDFDANENEANKKQYLCELIQFHSLIKGFVSIEYHSYNTFYI